MCTQIEKQRLQPNSFWVNANDESFASQDLFGDLEKTFATGRGKSYRIADYFHGIIFSWFAFIWTIRG